MKQVRESDSEPSDFMMWAKVEEGRRMAALAEELGLKLTFDEELERAKPAGHWVTRPEGQGAVRYSEPDLHDFWEEWRRRNP